MAEKRGDNSHIVSWIAKQGYTPDTRMQQFVDVYWGWLTSNNNWYHYSERRGFRVYKRERTSLCPAFMAADEWSSLIMQEQTLISSTDSARNDFLAEHFGDFALDNAEHITRGFGLGTCGWALEPRNMTDDAVVPDAEIAIQQYDATQIIPLTYSASECGQCAFVGRVEIGGRDYDQCQMHVTIQGERHIVTQLFDIKTRKPANVPGIVADLNTHAAKPTFALFRVAASNDHFGYCAMGASVFDKAIGAIKGVDEAWTSFNTHLRVGEPKVFVDSTMIEQKTEKGDDGSFTKSYYAFGKAGDIVFKMRKGEEGKAIDVVQPELCVDETSAAIQEALNALSITCKLGKGYFRWDAHTGVKTAKEVVSDYSMLARNIKRQQNAMRKTIVGLVEGYIELANSIKGAGIPDGDTVVTFDDSVITDTETDRAEMRADIAQGIAAEWEYRARFYGESEEDAKAHVPAKSQEYADLIG
jgi:hypothetical protein